MCNTPSVTRRGSCHPLHKARPTGAFEGWARVTPSCRAPQGASVSSTLWYDLRGRFAHSARGSVRNEGSCSTAVLSPSPLGRGMHGEGCGKPYPSGKGRVAALGQTGGDGSIDARMAISTTRYASAVSRGWRPAFGQHLPVHMGKCQENFAFCIMRFLGYAFASN